MGFKKHQPGCRCCGYGLLGNTNSDIVYILTPSTNISAEAMMQSGTGVNVGSLGGLGVGCTVVGANPEQGRLLVQKPDTSVWELEARTHAASLLWAAGTDVASHTLHTMIYQKEYGLAAGYTNPTVPPVKRMTINASGSYVFGPEDVVLDSTYQYQTPFVAPNGDFHIGHALDATGATAPDYVKTAKVYKDDVVHATSILHAKAVFSIGGVGTSRGLAIDSAQILFLSNKVITTGQYYGVIGGALTSEIYRYYDITSGGTIDISNEVFSVAEIMGQNGSLYQPLAKSLNNTRTNTSDIVLGTSGWWRINLDLSINTLLVGGGIVSNLLVTHPGD